MRLKYIVFVVVLLALPIYVAAQDNTGLFPGVQIDKEKRERERQEELERKKRELERLDEYANTVILIGHNYRQYCYYMSKHLRHLAFGYDGNLSYRDAVDYELLERSSRIAERVFKLCSHYLEYEKSGEAIFK